MKISKEARTRLSEEMYFAAKKMKAETNPTVTLFYFSATFAEVGRLVNHTWDADLVLMHDVLQSAYMQINQRVQMIAAGDRTVYVSPALLEALASATDRLGNLIRDSKDKDIPNVLAYFAELAYVTNGNGYYLMQKGTAKVEGVTAKK